MSTVLVVVIVIVVIIAVGAVAFFARGQARRRGLQRRFGPEYDRTIESHESTREAEQELLAREKRHDELEIHPLDPAARERHLAEWRQVQERFVDAPEQAVTEADHLLVRVMGERGYPTEGYEQQISDLSVEHASTIDRYRQAHDISTRAEAKKASTEDLRQAMVHYRALFTELLDTDEDAVTNGRETSGTATEPENASETAAETRADEPVAEPVVDPAAAEPVGNEPVAEPVGTTERDASKAEARDEVADESAEARTGARKRSGRRTARRDSDDEGA
jgi:type II secretory pathway pseudopilin PulG